MVVRKGDFRLILPPFELCELSYEENTRALRSMGWLHDPCGVRLAPEFLNEDVVVSRENVGLWDNVHVDISAKFIFFSKCVVVPLKIFSVPLYVFDHEIFLAEFIRVGEVVQDLIV